MEPHEHIPWGGILSDGERGRRAESNQRRRTDFLWVWQEGCRVGCELKQIKPTKLITEQKVIPRLWDFLLCYSLFPSCAPELRPLCHIEPLVVHLALLHQATVYPVS